MRFERPIASSQLKERSNCPMLFGTATYWIDLSTQTGKALFAILLASAARSSPMMLGAPDSGGAVTIGGYWYN
jgi:hypothetical protein